MLEIDLPPGVGIAPFYARDNMNGAYHVDFSRMQRV